MTTAWCTNPSDASPPALTPHDAGTSDHSRRRALILANIPQIKETYDNLEHIFNKLQFPTDVPFLFVAYLKMCNIVLGLAPSQATCGCPFCVQNFRNSTSNTQQMSPRALRTYNSITKNASNFD